MAEMSREDVIERLRWIDREAHDEWVLIPAEREATLRHAIAALALHDEHERLTAAHATLLSREAKEEALDYASWAGAIGAGVARRIKAGTDTDLEPKAAVTAFHHAIAARRLLDLDPEDAHENLCGPQRRTL
jgi:hypothetical protein